MLCGECSRCVCAIQDAPADLGTHQGRVGSMVKIRTDKRVATIQRDCAAEFDEEERVLEYPGSYMPQQLPQAPGNWMLNNSMEQHMRQASAPLPQQVQTPRQPQYITTKPPQREFLQTRPVLMTNQAMPSKQINYIQTPQVTAVTPRQRMRPVMYSNMQQGVAANFTSQGAMLAPQAVTSYAVNRPNVPMSMGMSLPPTGMYPQFQQPRMAFRNF